jgi:hypothetical protein
MKQMKAVVAGTDGFPLTGMAPEGGILPVSFIGYWLAEVAEISFNK